jgi:hypothetical protein
VGGQAGFSGPARPGAILAAFFLSDLHFPPRVPKDILGCGAGSVENGCVRRPMGVVGRVRHVLRAVRRRKTGKSGGRSLAAGSKRRRSSALRR